MSVGWGAMSGAAINIMLVPWWERRRGLAVSIAFNGATLGGVLIAPTLISLIDAVGFARALAVAALAQLVVMASIATEFCDEVPPRSGSAPTATPSRPGRRHDRKGVRHVDVATHSARGASGVSRHPSPSA